MISDKSAALISRLLTAVPVLQDDWDRYQQSYEQPTERFGDPDPEGFLLELSFELVRRYKMSVTGTREALQSTFAFLETECGQDAEVAEFIGDWFVGYLPKPDSPGAEVTEWLGPCLRPHLDRTRRENAVETPESTVAFVHGLAALAPGLADELREHLAEGYSPPPFVSEVTDKIVEKYVETAAAETGLPAPERALLAFMDREFARDKDVEDMLALWMVEHLPYPPDPGAGIVDLLGPNLTAELRRQRSGSEPSP